MESLEETLKHVESLRRDLTANLKEESGHWESPPLPYNVGEEVYTQGGGYYGGSSPFTSEEAEEFFEYNKYWVVDQPVEHDTQKRETAKKGLQQVNDSCEWYSGRYEAARALKKDNNDLSKDIDEWLKKLGENMKAVIRGEWETNVRRRSVDFDEYSEPYFVPDINGQETILDNHIISLAICDLDYLYDNLFDKKQREQAGKALGYSRLRIWFHELFVKA